MVDRFFYEAQGLSFGDQITLFGEKFTVRGIFTTPDYLTLKRLDTDFIADGSKFGLVMLSRDDFECLPECNHSHNR
jgi:hypothetical protein